ATRVLAPMTAIMLAGVLSLVGATQVSAVAHTITTGLIDPASATPITILSAILGAIFWNLGTWYFGMPSSSSYALIGGLVGASWANAGIESVLWGGILYKVAIPTVVSPIIGYGIAFSLMKLMLFWIRVSQKGGSQKGGSEKLFAHLQVSSAGIVALCHGLNDAQKSMGVITLGLLATGFLSHVTIPLWVIIACAVVMGLGTASGGMRIIRTVGFSITPLKPVQGFVAELSTSCVLLMASFLGMPISSTHMIVGSVAGVGSARKSGSVSWALLQKLLVAWLFTLPGSALMSAGFFIFISLIN
ncbi:MAG: inorganic phosphate transporter, partial [Chlamydiae bacterium]|nr:inorganic phosphate transporter [Chlamydiota bacterium]